MAHTHTREHAPAVHWRRIALLGLVTAWCLVVFSAAAQARGGVQFTTSPAETEEETRAELLGQLFPRTTAPTYRTVWEGRDVDGDGASDFANPTGHAPRAHDAYGSGAFGASRDGGHRQHEGVDYAADAGQTVVAPISGYVSRIGFAYGDDERYRYVEITNPALGYEARVFYVDPTVAVGQAVHVGAPIGLVRTLQDRYAGITDHVHLEIAAPGHGRIDATRMIAARTVLDRRRG